MKPEGPYAHLEDSNVSAVHRKTENIRSAISSSLSRHRYKEALRAAMKAAQYGNQIIQAAEPGSIYLRKGKITEANKSLATLAFNGGYVILSHCNAPFMPFSSETCIL